MRFENHDKSAGFNSANATGSSGIIPDLVSQIKVFLKVQHGLLNNQISKQVSNTLHHMNSAKTFTENSAMARLRDILRGLGPAAPEMCLSEIHGFTKLRMGLSCDPDCIQSCLPSS